MYEAYFKSNSQSLKKKLFDIKCLILFSFSIITLLFYETFPAIWQNSYLIQNTFYMKVSNTSDHDNIRPSRNLRISSFNIQNRSQGLISGESWEVRQSFPAIHAQNYFYSNIEMRRALSCNNITPRCSNCGLNFRIFSHNLFLKNWAYTSSLTVVLMVTW